MRSLEQCDEAMSERGVGVKGCGDVDRAGALFEHGPLNAISTALAQELGAEGVGTSGWGTKTGRSGRT